MIGLTNASIAKDVRGYSLIETVAGPTLTTLEPVWNTETKLTNAEYITTVQIPEPYVGQASGQSNEIRITFKVLNSVPSIHWTMRNSNSNYTIIWSDISGEPIFSANCLYEISLSPIADYISGYCREIDLV